jgi:hypothetical protein
MAELVDFAWFNGDMTLSGCPTLQDIDFSLISQLPKNFT